MLCSPLLWLVSIEPYPTIHAQDHYEILSRDALPHIPGLGTYNIRDNQDVPTYSVRAELVVLHATVSDKNGPYAGHLTSAAFSILEDGKRQTIQFFEEQDAPVTVGLLIDSSGSMIPAKDRVIAAATTFAEVSNPADEMFVLAFNDVVRAALPAAEPFTSDPQALRSALRGATSPFGGTALYDALTAGLAYLARGRYDRKVLVVVSDGGDNASISATFKETLKRVQGSNAVIYTIALTDPFNHDMNPKRLKALSGVSGGEAFVPRTVAHVEDAMHRISKNIRNAYTLGYVSTNSARDGRFRRVRVVARTPEGRVLAVRTRPGYAVGPG
jgi:Ca-activated chloride channel homolog